MIVLSNWCFQSKQAFIFMAGGSSAFCLIIESNIHLTCSCPVSRPCTQTQVCSYLHTDMHTQGKYLSCEQGHDCEPANYPLNSIQHIYPSIYLKERFYLFSIETAFYKDGFFFSFLQLFVLEKLKWEKSQR